MVAVDRAGWISEKDILSEVAMLGWNRVAPLFAMLACALAGSCLDAGNGARRGIERAAVCEYQARCGYIGASEEAACARAETYGPLPFLDGLAIGRETAGYSSEAAIADGRLAVDRQREADCLVALSDSACSGAGLASCFGLYVGRLDGGQACFDDHECLSGICASPTTDGTLWSGDPGCAGTCTRALQPGDPCGDTIGFGCSRTSYCDTATNTCKARLAEGDACDPARFECGFGQSCTGGVCRGPGAEGEACDDGALVSGCRSDLRCVADVCAPRGEVGEACTMPSGSGLGGLGGIGGGPCVEDAYCDVATGACRALHADGEACDALFLCADRHPCVGLTFDATGGVVAAGVCAPWGDVGSPCEASGISACPNDMVCDFTTSRCAPRVLAYVVLGDACDPARIAEGVERCVEGSCDASGHCALVCESPF